MPPVPSKTVLSQTVLQFVEDGAFPDTEQLASAELPADAVSAVTSSLKQARENVEKDIRSISKTTDSNISGWIAQASRLQADIEHSRAVARDIVAEAETGHFLQSQVKDAYEKVSLLERELKFNTTLASALEHIRKIEALVERAQGEVSNGNLVPALKGLQETRASMQQLRAYGYDGARVGSLLNNRVERLAKQIEEGIEKCWNQLLVVDAPNKKISILRKQQGKDSLDLEATAAALSNLSILDRFIERFAKDLFSTVIMPRLRRTSIRASTGLDIQDNSIQVKPETAEQPAVAVVRDIKGVVEFLDRNLPRAIAKQVFDHIAAPVTSRLISLWLTAYLPITANESLLAFEEVLTELEHLIGTLKSLDWQGHSSLSNWIDRLPAAWLQKRKETSLAAVRVLCSKSIKDRATVERVETERVSKSEVTGKQTGGPTTQDNAQVDDWDSGWNDQDEKSENGAKDPGAGDEADESAWGLDDDDNESAKDGLQKDAADDEDGGAWGWGDDDHDTKATTSTAAHLPMSQTNGETEEVTLRETYTVTAIPKAIIQTISDVVQDAEILASEGFSDSKIAVAHAGLYSTIPLILAMYRATAPAYYASEPAGNMLIYNDCCSLADELRVFIQQVRERNARAASRLRLDADLKALEGFGRRAYGREMESQRTILRDMIDGAQGFSNCNEEPYKTECENAVRITVDRIRDVRREWGDILSRSALLQSLGSLLSSVIGKIIVDIEDLSDISEEDSNRLKELFDIVLEIREVFIDESIPGNTVDMTSMWTPNWFKFQYLSEILESSLADIKYLWGEGELHMEFEADEVIDLIKALFADSEHRRKAIAEIRRVDSSRR